MKRQDIERLLPAVFQRTVTEDNLLTHLLELMAFLHAPAEEILSHLDAFFDPYRAPDDFVCYLATWVNLESVWESDTIKEDIALFPPQIRLRELVAEAAYLAKWRGTEQGLRRYLEVATGIDGFRVTDHATDSNGRPIPFHIVVYAPEGARFYRSIIERIIRHEKPAYVTHELIIGQVEEAAD